MTPFSERAEQMGLNMDSAYKGMFTYQDQYCEVVYRQLAPQVVYPDVNPAHETDGEVTPVLAIYTKGPDSVGYRYCGYVSNIYKFVGNDALNDRIRNSVQEVGLPVLREGAYFSYDYTRMRAEIVIQSSQEAVQGGDVMPVMIVNNSYNGTKAASLAFGIATAYNEERLTFSFSLGEIRQVHVETATTSLASAVSTYMQVFTEDILDMITGSFQKQIGEDEMMTLLELLGESFGKRRTERISELLGEVQGPNQTPTAWQVFLAIVRYTSFEPNINVRKMMENVAESVLVIPTRMHDVLRQLEAS